MRGHRIQSRRVRIVHYFVCATPNLLRRPRQELKRKDYRHDNQQDSKSPSLDSPPKCIGLIPFASSRVFVFFHMRRFQVCERSLRHT